MSEVEGCVVWGVGRRQKGLEESEGLVGGRRAHCKGVVLIVGGMLWRAGRPGHSALWVTGEVRGGGAWSSRLAGCLGKAVCVLRAWSRGDKTSVRGGGG